jgi:hypothetical protein
LVNAFTFTHTVTVDNDFIGIMDDAVTNGISNGGVVDFVIPTLWSELGTKDNAAAIWELLIPRLCSLRISL